MNGGSNCLKIQVPSPFFHASLQALSLLRNLQWKLKRPWAWALERCETLPFHLLLFHLDLGTSKQSSNPNFLNFVSHATGKLNDEDQVSRIVCPELPWWFLDAARCKIEMTSYPVIAIFLAFTETWLDAPGRPGVVFFSSKCWKALGKIHPSRPSNPWLSLGTVAEREKMTTTILEKSLVNDDDGSTAHGGGKWLTSEHRRVPRNSTRHMKEPHQCWSGPFFVTSANFRPL